MKWFIPTVSCILTILLLMVAHTSLAVTCTFGDSKITANSQYEARSEIGKACMNKYLSKYAQRAEQTQQANPLPDDEQIDYMIEDCVNNTRCG